MKHTLTELFCGIFRKQGWTVTPYECLEMVGFENRYFTGSLLFRSENKRYVIRWKCRQGYELYDIPFNVPGWTTAEFDRPQDLFLFLQRRLVWKKQHN